MFDPLAASGRAVKGQGMVSVWMPFLEAVAVNPTGTAVVQCQWGCEDGKNNTLEAIESANTISGWIRHGI